MEPGSPFLDMRAATPPTGVKLYATYLLEKQVKVVSSKGTEIDSFLSIFEVH